MAMHEELEMYRYNNAEQAFISLVSRVLGAGDDIVIRGMHVREMLSKKITIINPLQRCYFIPNRNDNIFAKIAETLWMIAGRNDIEWLSFYLPRAKDFSDDGHTWRGAYGPRLRNWNGADKRCDQLVYVLQQLNLDLYTRQAVISIWDPSEDTISVTKDRPCNNWIQFYARDIYADGKVRLNMNVTQRSCDLWWGYSGIDTFSWSILQQMLAFWTDLEVGEFNHFITSLHMYERHFDVGKDVVNTYVQKSLVEISPNIRFPRNIAKFATKFENLDDMLDYLFSLERNARTNPDAAELELGEHLQDKFLQSCYTMMFIYIMYKQAASLDDIGYVIDTLPVDLDFRMAAIEYLTRKDTDILQYIHLSTSETSMLSEVYNRI